MRGFWFVVVPHLTLLIIGVCFSLAIIYGAYRYGQYMIAKTQNARLDRNRLSELESQQVSINNVLDDVVVCLDGYKDTPKQLWAEVLQLQTATAQQTTPRRINARKR